MPKVDRNTIQNALNEANQLEYELSTDECYRELDNYDDMFDMKEYNNHEDDEYDWRNDDYSYLDHDWIIDYDSGDL